MWNLKFEYSWWIMFSNIMNGLNKSIPWINGSIHLILYFSIYEMFINSLSIDYDFRRE